VETESCVVRQRTNASPRRCATSPRNHCEERFRTALGEVLAAIDIPADIVGRELEAMTDLVVAKTASRSVLGTMNDFMFMAEHAIAQGHSRNALDLAVWLSRTPCSPLFKSTGSPDNETRLILTGQQPTRRLRTGPSPAK
jgi:hypothetical protein